MPGDRNVKFIPDLSNNIRKKILLMIIDKVLANSNIT